MHSSTQSSSVRSLQLLFGRQHECVPHGGSNKFSSHVELICQRVPRHDVTGTSSKQSMSRPGISA